METSAKTRRDARFGLLKDPVDEVRLAAAQSLEALEGAGSLEEVLTLLKKGDLPAKVRAIYALGQIGGEKVLAPLLYCITRPEEDLKGAAIEVLGTLAHPSTLSALAGKLR